MNDRTHFLLSCGLLILVISLVLRPQTSFPLPQQPAREAVSQQTLSLESIHRFLEIEEGLDAVDIEPPEFIVAEVKTTPVKADRKYIPLNVVPIKTSEKKSPETAQKIDIVSPKTRAIPRKLERQLDQVEANASDLIRQSEDSFSRGLLTLSDYELALNIAYQSKISVSETRDLKNARINLLQEKQNLIGQAVDQLQRMNQPAAQGWYGDVVHARLMRAQNQFEIAKALEDPDLKRSAVRDINLLASEYYHIRKLELGVGAADLDEYRRAARAVFVANLERNALTDNQRENAANLAEFASRLQGIQADVEMLSVRGAGLGRKDLVDLSKSHLAYVEGNLSRQREDKAGSQKFFDASKENAKAAWDVRINSYYPLGTATLHEVTSAWILWKSADQELKTFKEESSSVAGRELTAGLDQMINLTRSIEDRRGRMASDISLIYCLKDAEFLAELKQKSK